MVCVRVSEGNIEGDVIENPFGGVYYSFKGIPYAAPPVGDLRFKDPRPPKPWKGIQSAKEFGPSCYQPNFLNLAQPHSSEDCLYLNVYTSTIDPVTPLPVMFFIHGGGNDNLYGPEFLVKHGVILVTFNYRLGNLGFLCLETADIPGNAGMKDQVAALLWVMKNISKFGGDLDNITIFGEGVGAACVGYHLVSPMSKGLFKKAILQSGAATCWWSYTKNPRKRAFALARQLGCYSENDKELYEFFKSQPAEALVEIKPSITIAESAATTTFGAIGVVSEKYFYTNERFFCKDFTSEDLANIHEGVTVYAGYTKDEGLINIAIGADLETKVHQFNNFYEAFVPPEIAWHCVIDDQLKFGRQIKQFYFDERKIEVANWPALANFYATYFFKYNILHWIKTITKSEKNNVYLYKFGCVTERNVVKKMIGLEDVFDGPVVCHADDLFYLFNAKGIKEMSELEKETLNVIDKMTKLWTNIAKYGDPTPDDSLGAKWLPYSNEHKQYLNIENELQTGTALDEAEFNHWNKTTRFYAHQLAFHPTKVEKYRPIKQIQSRNLTSRPKPVYPTDSDSDSDEAKGLEVNLRYETWERYQDFWEETAQKKKQPSKRQLLTRLRKSRAPP